jgi:hypothetical protein
MVSTAAGNHPTVTVRHVFEEWLYLPVMVSSNGRMVIVHLHCGCSGSVVSHDLLHTSDQCTK